ncbi:DUF3667 domain-containing protein [Sphingomonas sp. BK235]|uniref:DUF3667 domain-containing protein n=1 Tax=Sphingomonas sp. BK235 TaxID=2512131 RepID=UPI0010E59087|nr:DUF3667 domain-containing protein [Sphingomonas sp. BK235]TCP36934.1 uncharacterized protein DUF3667 [Sphingomonas sp. BK235]
MSGIGEGLAELGQGAMAALATERAVAADGHTHETVCLNCATPLIGTHCHACGQAAHVHRTLGAFFHDLLHGVFHFEGRVWRTLPLLAWQPGRLTREYIDGRRASYVSPIALFLFGMFLMFAVFHATGAPETADGAQVQTVGEAIARGDRRVAALEQRRRAAQGDRRALERIDERLAEERATLKLLHRLDPDAPSAAAGQGNGQDQGFSDIPTLDHAIRKFRANPDLATYKIQTYAYKYSWALIPISVPFLWLLFPFNRRFRFYDHTVFVTYSLCFMTLLAIAAMLLGAVGLGGAAGLLMLLPPWHMYRQLRGAYALGRGGALVRTALLLLFALLALGLFFVMIMAQTSL